MRKKLLFTNNTFYVFIVFFLFVNYGWSQQTIGEFPIMDGGLESQTATTTMSSAGSSQINTPQTEWTVSSTSNSGVRTISDVPSEARSGNFSAAFSVLAGKSNNRLQTPSSATPPILVNTEYTVQFFYKTDTDPGTDLDPGIYLNNTSDGVAGDKTDVTPFAINTWTKTYRTITTGPDFNASNWAVARISTTTPTGYNSIVNIDDFVVYSGGFDDAAPSAPTAPTYSKVGSDITIGWTAPAGGVDGGGYVVVRYATAPNADNDPNQNGIYQVNNTTTNGTGSLVGTIVYIGTNTSIIVTNPTSSDYFYKIYAVDKAFNYSNELLASSALGIAKNNISNFKIYPNPAKNNLTIESNNIKISSVEMYNILGAKVISERVLVNNSLNISNLSKGIYMLKINAEGSSTTKKVLIN